MSIERARPRLEPEPVPGPRAAGERGTPGPGPSYARGDLLAAVRALAPRLRAASDEIEQARTMPEPLVEAMADAGFYRMLLPRALSGGEIDALTYFDVVEALARADSAAGWSVVISTSSMVSTVRGLPDDTLAAMFTSPRRTIMAGSAPPRGRAHPVDGGYRVTGRWTQGSNIAVAGWVRVGCHVFDGAERRRGPDGGPVYVTCLFPATQAQVIDTWRTTGMRGTGSHDFAVADLFVPGDRVHGVLAESPRPETLYRFAGWTHVGHAALGLGIARVAIETFVEMAGGKTATWLPGEGRLADRGTIQARVARAEALVGSGRAYVLAATREAWETVGRGEALSPEQRAIYRLSVAHAMAGAVEAVDLMYSAGGASAIYAASRLDRCLRDAHTAAAHVWVAPDTYELAGRLLLGLDPGSATI
ncbi:MAG TPA: acyl-CoA dehydrogenase family protein [Candidatus Binatia bacterium]|nr:acyl-CoA dehydrogenase family protein [Candidatus Binatia bacterium]